MLSPLILVINCGSSSLKFALFPLEGRTPVLVGLAECLGQAEASIRIDHAGTRDKRAIANAGHQQALDCLLGRLGEMGLLEPISAVGHRVVHGGERFTGSAPITPEVLADIEACAQLAPLHNRANLIGIFAAMKALPDTPQVAVFDTAFHQTMPPEAYLYALPRLYHSRLGVRRYGFHGTSHRFVAAEAVKLLGLDPDHHGLIIAHLGNGASATAVLNGRSVDTTMGMTPLEGLVMGTRSGDVDFGVLAHIARHEGLDIDGLEALLNKTSGLLGLSGLSGDCRALQEAASQGHAGATEALGVFVHRLVRHIGALAMSLPRLDALIFTGGIGENSALIRGRTLDHLGLLGFELDSAANDTMPRGESGVISRGAGPKAAVLPTNEEWMIAHDTAAIAGLLSNSAQNERLAS
ncbi:acetate/propionate family kinase [Rhodospirillum rubrum]|uniref:Acetate kinase n=1 Tax=Rhodospirillum rubrum (strain ATCC 11170 / ATH 1.1.1 / DSM 467 / LMG 4362 / NCIMB 8255 / S1) TaxID=269796 RepID=Q2RUL5_RHORT|nr:acetate kinase [Rhodospirillum rubrum]ABC22180.1 acetate kinase [Rhodospirillum rubrum ATCC 11170]AEO47895.1 acetate kinase [Rhodospirillum rubrum F11]MBK5953770.1 acetate kinase [Rhodospirillum rubrum]QXG81828.1 acetate kinase [Rhodospirillum rubrum]HAQ00547.1 acetate kinase [Rhodospirillum rubrum]